MAGHNQAIQSLHHHLVVAQLPTQKKKCTAFKLSVPVNKRGKFSVYHIHLYFTLHDLTTQLILTKN
jgi:hypothetical protein